MVTLNGDEELDEAHCLWALCQHPCCWETEHRIAEGVCRRRVKASNHVESCAVKESFPSLTVVNVSVWADKTQSSKGKTLYTSVMSESGPSPRTSCPPIPAQRVKITNTPLPPISSQHSSFKYNGMKEKVAKLHKAQISPLIGSKSPWGLGAAVIWIPNPNRTPVPFVSKSSESQYSVKDLTCFPTFPIKSVKCKTQERKKHTCTSRAFHSRGQKDSPSRNPATSIESGLCRASEERGLVMGEPQVRIEKSSTSLTKKHIFFPGIQDRRYRSRRVSKDATTPPLKLNSKTDGESIDRARLKGQVYLWRKHHIYHNPPRGASVPQNSAGSCSAPKMSPTKTPGRIPRAGRRSVVPVAQTSKENSNPSPNPNPVSSIIGETVKPWTGTSTTQRLCIS